MRSSRARIGVAIGAAFCAAIMSSCTRQTSTSIDERVRTKSGEIVLYSDGFRVDDGPVEVRLRVDVLKGQNVNAAILVRPSRLDKPTQASFKDPLAIMMDTRSVTIEAKLEPGLYEALVTPTFRHEDHEIRVRFEIQPL